MSAPKSEQRIFRGKHSAHFAIVPNAVVEHSKLSLDTKGLAVYLISRPQNWHIRPRQLAVKLRVGKDRLQRMMRELIDAGFLQRKRMRKAGKFVGMDYFVHDVAILPQPEKPSLADPALVQPAAVFQADYKERNVIKKDSEQVTSSARGASSQSPSRATRAAGSGKEGSATVERPEVVQHRIALRLGSGNVEQGWTLFGALSERQQNELTAQERCGQLADSTIVRILDEACEQRMRARASH